MKFTIQVSHGERVVASEEVTIPMLSRNKRAPVARQISRSICSSIWPGLFIPDPYYGDFIVSIEVRYDDEREFYCSDFFFTNRKFSKFKSDLEEWRKEVE